MINSNLTVEQITFKRIEFFVSHAIKFKLWYQFVITNVSKAFCKSRKQAPTKLPLSTASLTWSSKTIAANSVDLFFLKAKLMFGYHFSFVKKFKQLPVYFTLHNFGYNRKNWNKAVALELRCWSRVIYRRNFSFIYKSGLTRRTTVPFQLCLFYPKLWSVKYSNIKIMERDLSNIINTRVFPYLYLQELCYR